MKAAAVALTVGSLLGGGFAFESVGTVSREGTTLRHVIKGEAVALVAGWWAVSDVALAVE